MKRILRLSISLILLFAISFSGNAQELLNFLNQQPEIKQVKEIECNDFFNVKYEIMVQQPVDHLDSTAGYFLQRVFVADHNKDNPTVVITEGYAAHYGAAKDHINELCPILDANQICIEHRYFGQSVPEPLNWDYLTVENAVTDHHKIVQLFKQYYQSKWISTGISKGGQTCMSYREYFPDDVDVTVAYVAPLNFSVEDGRHEPFIANVPGTKKDRKKVLNFQKDVFKRKQELLPLLKDYSEEKKYTFKMPLEEVFDFTVLEYSFSFWQWGSLPDSIPAKKASNEKLFNHLVGVCSPDYFAEEGIEPTRPFFVQAARQLGYYGYDTRKFRKHLSIQSAKGYLKKIFLPEDLNYGFEPEAMNRMHNFLQKTNKKMMFIYGANDPWSATGVNIPKVDNLIKVVKDGGCHRARINNLPEEQKTNVISILKRWIN